LPPYKDSILIAAPRPIFIQTALGGSSSWDPIIQGFDGGIIVTLPLDDDGDDAYSADVLVERLGAAISRIPGPRVIVGTGLGGMLGMEIARSFPYEVDALIAIGCAAQCRIPTGVRGTTADIADNLVAHGVAIADGDLVDDLALALARSDPKRLLRELDVFESIRLHDTAHEILCPTLVIVGAHDTWAIPHDAEALARSLARHHFVIVEDAGHFVHVDAPETLRLLITAFLARFDISTHRG
jgi:pimeloyl-ACP methyl ester carboxylesterase